MKDKELRKLIGSRVKQRRLELNLTQPYVVEKMGVTASTILRYENGSIDNTKKMVLEGLSEALHVSVEWLKQYISSGIITDVQAKRIAGYKFKDWARLSKNLLCLNGCDKHTGEIISLIRAMWEYNLNFMELINSEEFTFRDELEGRKRVLEKSLHEFQFEDLKDYYYSAPVKRMIWQTVLALQEITQIMRHNPKRIFIEMTRTEEEKGEPGRKASREKRLLKLYENIRESRDWTSEIKNAGASGSLNSKKLYLYYLQMGKDAYTGEEIDIEELFTDNRYDIDHIYPRSLTNDNNIDNNLVLVSKKINQDEKKNDYPLPEKVRSKAGNYVPLKVKDTKLQNVEKYGGYTSLKPAYFTFIEHGSEKKRKRCFEVVQSYYASQIKKESDLIEFLEKNGYKNPRVIAGKIKKNSLIKYNGYLLYVIGMDARKNIEFSNATPMCLENKYIQYVSKLEKAYNEIILSERKKTEPRLSEKVTIENNLKLYRELTDKHVNSIYRNHPRSIGDILEKGEDKFESLDLVHQIKILYNLVLYTSFNRGTFSLTDIGGPKEVGRIRISGNMTEAKELKLIHYSVTGLYKKEIDLLNQ